MSIYNLLLLLIRTYGIQLRGAANKSHTNEIRTFQFEVFRLITNAPPYTSNSALRNDLNTSLIKDAAKQHYRKFHSRLFRHTDPLILNLSFRSRAGNPPRRLKRQRPRETFSDLNLLNKIK